MNHCFCCAWETEDDHTTPLCHHCKDALEHILNSPPHLLRLRVIYLLRVVGRAFEREMAYE
jgi:hypothetical protein